MSSKQLKIVRDYIIGWFLASLIWQLLRGSQDANIPFMNQSGSNTLAVFVFVWLVQGLLYGLLYIFLDRFVRKRIPLIRLMAMSLLLQLVTVIVVFFLLFYVFTAIGVFNTSISLIEFLQLPLIWVGLLYTIIVNFFISIVISINLMLGKGNLMKFMSGKFYTPKEEELIFMFLDLRSSTTLAESLGHIQYSQMIQDCFYDLAVVEKYGASVYQYVGDEAVLTWTYNEGIENDTCVRAFYAFKDQLDRRSEYYLAKYNVEPKFKAGMNSGIITVAEVGEFKREIAYHGDTINTAARLEGECNRLKADLVISEKLLKAMDVESWAASKFEGEILLKGKQGVVNMYSIQRGK